MTCRLRRKDVKVKRRDVVFMVNRRRVRWNLMPSWY